MLVVVLACLWVVAATVTALLPMRLQYAPGVTLLALAPVLIAALGWSFGPWAALAATAAFVSMFRRPLVHFWRKFTGWRAG